MCNWGDHLARCAFVSMCLYTSAAQRLGYTGKHLVLFGMSYLSPYSVHVNMMKRKCKCKDQPHFLSQLFMPCWFLATLILWAVATPINSNHENLACLPPPAHSWKTLLHLQWLAVPGLGSNSGTNSLPWESVCFQPNKCPMHMWSKPPARGLFYRIHCSFRKQQTFFFSVSRIVILNLQCTSESPVGLVKRQSTGHPTFRISHSVGMWLGPDHLNKSPDNNKVAGPGTTVLKFG